MSYTQPQSVLPMPAPWVALFASRPIALEEGLRALADVVEHVKEQQGRVG